MKLTYCMKVIAAVGPYISEFIDSISSEILADYEDSYAICYEVAHKQCDST